MGANTERKGEGQELSPVGPHKREAEEDSESTMLTQIVLSVIYNLNHCSAMLLIPTRCSKQKNQDFMIHCIKCSSWIEKHLNNTVSS